MHVFVIICHLLMKVSWNLRLNTKLTVDAFNLWESNLLFVTLLQNSKDDMVPGAPFRRLMHSISYCWVNT